MTNPSTVKTTESFTITSFSKMNTSDFVLMETGGTDLTMTPIAGSINS